MDSTKTLLSFLLSLFFITPGLQSQTVNFTSSNLPVIVINTDGQVIPGNERITARMAVIWNENGQRNFLSDSGNNYNGRIAIELHGQSSLGFPKKSYRIETQDTFGENNNVNLLGMPRENDWILHAPYSDKSLLRNVLVYSIAAEINLYAPRVQFCELILNDQYRGVYVLTERIKRDNNRIDITEMQPDDVTEPGISGGYIFKKDKIDPGDNVIQLNRGLELVIIEPKNDQIVAQQTSWLRNHLNAFDNAITSGGDYSSYMDVKSFVDNFLQVEWSKNIDGLRLSTYFYKDRNDKIVAGPVWDYNLALGNADYNDGWTYIGWYYEHITFDNNWHLLLIKDPQFYDLCIKRWKELRRNKFSIAHIFEKIDDLVELLQEAQARNFEQFPILGTYIWPNPGYPESGSFGYNSPTSGAPQTWQEEITFIKDFIRGRLQWMDEEFGLNFVQLSVDVQQKGWGHILYNNRILDDETYLGSFPTDQHISLRAEAQPGYKFVRWEAVQTGDQKSTWIAQGDLWRYLDNGSDQGSAWYSTEFDDTVWQQGPAELGYGDNDEATLVSYGPDGQNKYITTYFCKHFDVTDADSYSSLNLYLLRDDGAVVYLNGNEVVRSNMPQTSIAYNTFALEYVDGEAEKSWYTFAIDPQFLVEGENVIAVEIHQQNLTSSDISFDLRFAGEAANLLRDTTVISYTEQLNYLPAANTILNAVFKPVSGYASNLVINEIHYNPADSSGYEFLELTNASDSTIDLSGYYFREGIEFTFPQGTDLAPGTFIVIVQDTVNYPDLPCTVFQWTSGELSNIGELLLLADSLNQTVDSVFYRSETPWPTEANGMAYSLELKNILSDNALAENWQNSYRAGGSAGKPTIRIIKNLFVNEFLASNSQTNTDETGESDDWIEIYNAGEVPVDVRGLYLSDNGSKPGLWKIPDISPYTTTIKPDSFLLFWADKDSSQGILHTDFQLGRAGETILLSQIVAQDTILIDKIDFPEQQTDISMGRYPDGTENWQFLYQPTPGYKNKIITAIDDHEAVINKFSLSQNYPNPFNPLTIINYQLPITNHVKLTIYDILGREITILVDEKQSAGQFQVVFDASELASGIYIYTLETNNGFRQRRKLLLLK